MVVQKSTSTPTENEIFKQELQHNSMSNVIQNIDKICKNVLIMRKRDKNPAERDECRNVLLILDGLDESENMILRDRILKEKNVSFVQTFGLTRGSKDSQDNSVWPHIIIISPSAYLENVLNQTTLEFPLKLTPNSLSDHTLQEYLTAFFVHNMYEKNWKNGSEMTNSIR